MIDGIETPAYVISDTGSATHVSFEDGWVAGPSEYLGRVNDADAARTLIVAHIRRSFDDRNGLPLYHVSDHGNVSRRRRVTLRSRTQPTKG